MTQSTRPTRSRWAPWWVYVVVLVPANLLKQSVLGDVPVALNVAATAAVAVVGITVITALHRALR